MTRTTAANFVVVDTTEETLSDGLTFTFADTSRFPAVPFYAVLARTDDTRRNVVKFSTKTATTLQCASLADRYLAGSVAESGITHPAGTPVLVAPLAQNLGDIWDALENRFTKAESNAAYEPLQVEEGFRARRASGQTLAAATLTKIVFDTEDRDDGADYDTATGNWTVPDTGWYDVATGIYFNPVVDGERVIVSIYVGGAEHTRLFDGMSGGAVSWQVSGSLPLYLTAAAVVNVYAYRQNAGDVGAALMYFTAKRRY